MALWIADRAGPGYTEWAKPGAVIIPGTRRARQLTLLVFDAERRVAATIGVIGRIAGLAAVGDTLRRPGVVTIPIAETADADIAFGVLSTSRRIPIAPSVGPDLTRFTGASHTGPGRFVGTVGILGTGRTS